MHHHLACRISRKPGCSFPFGYEVGKKVEIPSGAVLIVLRSQAGLVVSCRWNSTGLPWVSFVPSGPLQSRLPYPYLTLLGTLGVSPWVVRAMDIFPYNFFMS